MPYERSLQLAALNRLIKVFRLLIIDSFRLSVINDYRLSSTTSILHILGILSINKKWGENVEVVAEEDVVEDVDEQGKVVEPCDEQLRQLEEDVDEDNFRENVYIYVTLYCISYTLCICYIYMLYLILK